MARILVADDELSMRQFLEILLKKDGHEVVSAADGEEALTRFQARQFAGHGHFMINGRRVTIPSYRLKQGDVVAVRPRSKGSPSVLKTASLSCRMPSRATSSTCRR